MHRQTKWFSINRLHCFLFCEKTECTHLLGTINKCIIKHTQYHGKALGVFQRLSASQLLTVAKKKHISGCPSRRRTYPQSDWQTRQWGGHHARAKRRLEQMFSQWLCSLWSVRSKLKKLIRYIKSKRGSFQEEEREKKLQRYETDHFLEPFAGLTPEYMEMSESQANWAWAGLLP